MLSPFIKTAVAKIIADGTSKAIALYCLDLTRMATTVASASVRKLIIIHGEFVDNCDTGMLPNVGSLGGPMFSNQVKLIGRGISIIEAYNQSRFAVCLMM